MAAPTAASLTSITTEALKKAGYSSPSDARLTRAQDEFVEEIKNDIWLLGKRLQPLMAEHVEILAGGRSRYDFPSGFSSVVSAKVLYGDEVFDVAGAAAATVTLDSDQSEGEDEMEGKEIVIYSGTGKGQVSQCYSYDDDTYIASVSPSWSTQPVAGDTYFVADLILPLEFKTVPHFNLIEVPHETGPPQILYAVGDEDHYGYYHLFPTPDEDHYYAIRLNYYLNLLTLDLASSRMTMLYARWRNLFIQGVKAKQWESDDDSRADLALERYFKMVRDTVALETYGRNNIQHHTGVRA